MELSDLEARAELPRSRRQQLTDNCCPPHRFISLRKYSTPICIIEALAIASLVLYLLLWASPQEANRATGNLNGGQYTPQLPLLLLRDGHGNSLSQWLSGRPAGCTQRTHDLQYSVICSPTKAAENSCNSPLDILANTNDADKTLSGLGPKVRTIVTARDGARLQEVAGGGQRVKKLVCTTSDKCRFRTLLRVRADKYKQRILGWGGALSDSSLSSLLSLTTNGTRRLLDDYFADDGLQFNMIRITIGGSDFSSRFYTNDDLEGGNSTDFKLEKFSLRAEDLLYKIPVLQYIFERFNKRPMRLFGSMWSPPTWMKDNHHFNKGRLIGSSRGPIFAGGGHEDGDLKAAQAQGDGRYFETLAKLKRKFLLEYKKHGVNFWALTVMNEPIFAVQPFLDFNTMILPAVDYANYVATYLGPTLREEPALKHVKLIAHDDNRRYLMNYTDAVLQVPSARNFIDGISTHGYIDQDYHLMEEIYQKYKTKQDSASDESFFVLPTELSSGHLPFMQKALAGNWHRGVHYALDIIRGLQHSAAGWVDWNMVLDMEGGPGWLGSRLDSPILVDKARDSYHKSPMFYVLGQFSRYIPPESRRLESEIENSNYDYQFETVSFKTPSDEFVTVCLNNNPYPIELNVKFVGLANKQTEQQATASKEETFYTLTCQSDSLTTFIFPKDSLVIS